MEISAEKLTGKQKFLKVYFMSLQQWYVQYVAEQ